MEIKHIAVFGSGQMGRQMAMCFALHGYTVAVADTMEQALESARKWAAEYLDGRVAKGKLNAEQAKACQDRLTFTGDAAGAVADADLVVEAIIEQEEAKCTLFAQLDQLCPAKTILASNSSFIPASTMAAHVQRKDKVANLHFFNPALVMKLVEVVQNQWTSDETIQTLMAFAVSCEKTPIWVKKEIDGFVANRILSRITEEALQLVQNGIVTPQEVDIAVENGLNHPLGPYRLMDLVGIDISYLSRVRRYEKSHDEKDRPPRFLEEKYQTGEFGRKTGKGWYTY